jgi:predicted negative regulator of RcsB-dependent stress response
MVCIYDRILVSLKNPWGAGVTEHILRKDLKRDEIRDTMVGTFRAIVTHEKTVGITVGVLAVIALAIFGWKTHSDRQTVKAEALFNVALGVYTGSSQQPVTGQPAPTPTQKDYVDAEAKFRQLALTYPHTRPGQLAHYYAALSLEKLDNNDEARKWLQGMAEMHDADFAAMAKYALAELDAQAGKGEDAAKIYQQLIDKPSVLVPKPVAMLSLADYYSTTKPAEAARLYNEIKSEYPNTPAAQQADQRLNWLGGKS